MEKQYYLVNINNLSIVSQSNNINDLIELQRHDTYNLEIGFLNKYGYIEFHKTKWFIHENFLISIELLGKWFFLKYYELQGSELIMVKESNYKEIQKLRKQAYKFVQSVGAYIEMNNIKIK